LLKQTNTLQNQTMAKPNYTCQTKPKHGQTKQHIAGPVLIANWSTNHNLILNLKTNVKLQLMLNVFVVNMSIWSLPSNPIHTGTVNES
jgi:hypothetical protein